VYASSQLKKLGISTGEPRVLPSVIEPPSLSTHP